MQLRLTKYSVMYGANAEALRANDHCNLRRKKPMDSTLSPDPGSVVGELICGQFNLYIPSSETSWTRLAERQSIFASAWPTLKRDRGYGFKMM